MLRPIHALLAVCLLVAGYGLSREQNTHVLSTFSHKSYTKAPSLCLDKIAELRQLGLDAFTKKHDPYCDLPLNENLPQPVIELPVPKTGMDEKGNKMMEWG